jgi:hypothetical protein
MGASLNAVDADLVVGRWSFDDGQLDVDLAHARYWIDDHDRSRNHREAPDVAKS